MKYTNKFLGALCLAAFGFASCADDYSLLDYEGVEMPADMAAYEYLKEYDDLKSYVDRSANPNFKLGTGITAADYNEKGLVYRLANANFDEVTAGNAMKHASVVGNDGTMNFGPVSDFVSAAKEAGTSIYGHTLAWHAQQNKKYLNSLIAPIIIPGEPVEGGDGGHALVLKNETGDGSNGWSAQTWYVFDKALTNGSTYTLSFWVKGTEAFTLGAWFKMGADGEQIYHQPGNYNVTTEWTEVTNTFTVGNDGVDRFIFNFGNYNPEGTIYIDKIQFVEEGATENWIKNDDFEEGHTEGWAYWTIGKNYAVSEDGKGYSTGGEPGYALRLKNESGNGGDNWSAQVWYAFDAPLVNGTTYTLSFMAKGTEAYTMGSWLCKGLGGDQIYHQPGNYNITTEWTELSNTFTVGSDDVDRFIFNFGNYSKDATIFIDDIKLVEDGGDENLIKNGNFEEQHVEGWGYWSTQNYAISELGEGYVDNGPSDIIIEKTPEEKKTLLIGALDAWVAGMMEATDGYVSSWDVVNEPISGVDADGDGFYDLQSASNVSEADAKSNFYWADYLGNEDYVPTVVKLAQKYYTGNQNLKLFINDFNLESWWDDNKKLKSLIHWIEVWENSDIIKIDGIGTQMHVSYILNEADQKVQEDAIVNMFKLLAATGKLVKISELDMGITENAFDAGIKTENITEEMHMKMADFYQFIINKYFELIPAEQQYGITHWCPTDSPANSGWRGGEPVGLWDANYNRKHVYAGFADGLAGIVDGEVEEDEAVEAE